MYRNSYEGLVESWKIDLIKRRARRLGICRHDLQDAQQEIIRDILNFTFDAAKSNGASEKTALTSLIDRRLMTILRTKSRYERHVLPQQTVPGSCDNEKENAEEPWVDPIEEMELVMDVRECLAKMSTEDKVVCLALAKGYSITQIARQLRRSWSSVNKIVSRIRDHFESVGLDGWIRG